MRLGLLQIAKGPFTHTLRSAARRVAVRSIAACFSVMNIHM